MTGAKCVLVIDDEDSVRSMTKAALTKAGYQVFWAANGIEGLKVLETQTVELVLTDVLMPEKEGAETIVEIRQRFPSVRIIAMSGGGRTENMRPLKIAGDLGADVLLAKPFDLDNLLAMVESVIVQGPRHCGPADAS